MLVQVNELRATVRLMKHPEAEAAGAREVVAVEFENEQAPARREAVGSCSLK